MSDSGDFVDDPHQVQDLDHVHCWWKWGKDPEAGDERDRDWHREDLLEIGPEGEGTTKDKIRKLVQA